MILGPEAELPGLPQLKMINVKIRVAKSPPTRNRDGRPRSLKARVRDYVLHNGEGRRRALCSHRASPNWRKENEELKEEKEDKEPWPNEDRNIQ